jgi:hypothetical protein
VEIKASLVEKVIKTPSQQNKPHVVAHACHPATSEAIGRRITVQGWPWAKVRCYLKNNLKQKGAGGVAVA